MLGVVRPRQPACVRQGSVDEVSMRYVSIAHHSLSVCALVLIDSSSRMHQDSLNEVNAFGMPPKDGPKTPSASQCSHRTRRMLSLRECVHVWLTACSAFFFARRIVFCRTSSVPRSHLAVRQF